MKIAVPVANKQLCMHFGHCEVFIFFDVDQNTKTITSQKGVTPPPHEPGVLPKWISEQGATVVLAGGMGQRAQGLFSQNGIEVVVGITESDPEKAVISYINGNLATGINACDH